MMELRQPPNDYSPQLATTNKPPLDAISIQDLTTNLTIRFPNNTRLQLPITGCKTISENLSNDSRRESLNACFVDWTQVKFVRNILNGNANGTVTKSHQILTTQLDLQTNEWTNNETTYDFLRFSYLSINSLLALCGILVNLFVILILVFNLRQKRRSTGINMAAKNNLLLFQLTVTGIILGTYMLTDNINICTQINYLTGLGSGELCDRPLLALPVPLLTFLPKTYFHWKTKVNDKSISETSTSTVIILKYLTNSSLNEIDAEDWKSSRYIDLRLGLENRTRRFDLSSDNLEISTATLSCHQEEASKDKSSTKQFLNSSIATNSSKLILIMGAIPLFVNIVASAHIWTVAALAYDRYRAIAHPFQYLSSVHTSRSKTFFMLSWLILLTLNLVLPITVNYQGSAYGSELEEKILMTHWYRWLLDSFMRIYHLDLAKPKVDAIQTHINGSVCSLTPLKEVGCDNSVEALARHLASLFQESATKLDGRTQYNNLNNELHVIMLIVLSFVGFLAVILLPLIIITICNIRIYRIVKVHERRLSFSSSTTMAASNLTLQQQQQLKQVSPLVQVDLHQQMMIRRKIADQEAILDKQAPLIRRVIRLGQTDRNKLRSSQEETTVSDSVAEVQRKQRLSSNESLQDNRNNGFGLSGAILNSGSESPHKRIDRPIVSGASSGYISRYGIVPRRVSSGDESYYENDPNSKESLINPDRGPTIYRFLRSASSSPGAYQRCTLSQRKMSDSSIFRTANKDCITSTQQHMSDTDLESPTLSNSPSYQFKERNDSSSGILNQLKLAGLSFAGIAIQQPLTGANSRKTIRKSSSTCSFGGSQSNLNWNHRQSSCDQSPQSRNSYDSSIAGVQIRRSYVSLNGSLKQYDDFSNSKYKTKLLEEPQTSYTTPTQSSSRLTLSFGTKSAIFNILVWLIMTLLLLTLPHYLFSIFKPITKLSWFGGRQNELLGDEHIAETLHKMIRPFTGNQNQSSLDWWLGEGDQSYSVDLYLSTLTVKSIIICLACLSRLLFLIIIPLNGCLYGFSSRSFRTTIKMILKRYISKKQASIEINQRHRPLSAIHQRASSCSDFPSMLHESKDNTISNKESDTRGLKKSSSSWKLMKFLGFKSEGIFNNWPDLQKSRSKMEVKGSEDINKSQYRFITPQISLDDSYCQSQSLSDNYDVNFLANSLTSSIALACSVVDLGDINYLREDKNSPTMTNHKEHLLSQQQRQHTGNRARAVSVSSVEQNVNISKVSSIYAPMRGHNIRSKSVDYNRNNILLGGCAVSRINKDRTRRVANYKLRNGSRSASNKSESGCLVKNRNSLHSSNRDRCSAKSIDTLWKRIGSSIGAIITRDRSHLFRANNKGLKNDTLNEQVLENHCSVAFLNGNPPGSQHSSSWLYQRKKWINPPSQQGDFSNSTTIDSIDSINSNSIIGTGCCVMRPLVQHSKEHLKSCNSNPITIQDKNPLYLKPPSFLKLSLDVGGHMNHTYRITSALSPIRESSSNHSYASSQSSLANNTSKTQNWLAAIQDNK